MTGSPGLNEWSRVRKHSQATLQLVRAYPRRVLTGTDKAKSIPTPIPENSFSVFYGYRDL
jgi:hypothetical protein